MVVAYPDPGSPGGYTTPPADDGRYGSPQAPSLAAYPLYQPYGQAGPPSGLVPPPGTVQNLPSEAFGGFWIRLVAIFIDWLVLVVPTMILTYILYMALDVDPTRIYDLGLETASSPEPGEELADRIVSLLDIVVAWLYYALTHSRCGASVGKLALGLRVVDERGMFITFGRATGRYFATLLSTCTCLVGYIIAAFDPQKRSMHDRIATTRVVLKDYVNPAVLNGYSR